MKPDNKENMEEKITGLLDTYLMCMSTALNRQDRFNAQKAFIDSVKSLFESELKRQREEIYKYNWVIVDKEKLLLNLQDVVSDRFFDITDPNYFVNQEDARRVSVKIMKSIDAVYDGFEMIMNIYSDKLLDSTDKEGEG
jgi:hypothetical protein